MNRWLPILTLACAACSPAEEHGAALPLCPRFEERCVVQLPHSDFWSEPPAQLAPNEAVVEAEHLGGYVTTTRTISETIVETFFGEELRACTSVNPIAVHHYRVTRVVSGNFSASEFTLLARSGYGCDSDNVALGLTTDGLRDGKPGYLVIRPADPVEGINPHVGLRLGPDGAPVAFTLPLMMHRIEGADLQTGGP